MSKRFKRKPDEVSDDDDLEQKATKIAKTKELKNDQKVCEIKTGRTTTADRLFGEILEGNPHPMRQLRSALTGICLLPVLLDIVFDYLRPRVVALDWVTIPTGLPEDAAYGLLGLLAHNLPVIWTDKTKYCANQSQQFIENKNIIDFRAGIEGAIIRIPSSHRGARSVTTTSQPIGSEMGHPISSDEKVEKVEKVEFGTLRVLRYHQHTRQTSLHAISGDERGDVSSHGQILTGYVLPYHLDAYDLCIATFSPSSTTYFALSSQQPESSSQQQERHQLYVYRYADLDRDPDDRFARGEFKAKSPDKEARKHDMPLRGLARFPDRIIGCAFDFDTVYVTTTDEETCDLYILSLPSVIEGEKDVVKPMMTILDRKRSPLEHVYSMCMDSHGLIVIGRTFVVRFVGSPQVMHYQMM
jgi:hypothetical protein